MSDYTVHLFKITKLDVTSNRVLRETAKVISAALGLPRRGFIYIRRLPDGEMVVSPLFGGFLTALARGSRQSLDVFVVVDDPEIAAKVGQSVYLLRETLDHKLGASGCEVTHESMIPSGRLRDLVAR